MTVFVDPPTNYITEQAIKTWEDDLVKLKNALIDTIDNHREGRMSVGLVVDALICALIEAQAQNVKAWADDHSPRHLNFFDYEAQRIKTAMIKTVVALYPDSVCQATIDFAKRDSH